MIKNHPLIERLSRLHETRMSGMLALSGDRGEEITLHLYDGFIDAVTSSDQQERLGQALVREGLLDEKELGRFLARAHKEDMHLGELAVAEGLITPALLLEMITEEARIKLARAVDGKWGLGTFDQQAEQFRFPMRLTPQQVVLDLVRRNGVSFEGDNGQLLSLTGDVDLTMVRWTPKELAILTELRAASTLDQLIAATNLEELEVRKTLRAVDELGALDLSEDTVEVDTEALAPADLIPLEHIIPQERSLALDEKIELATHGSAVVSEYFKSLKVRLDEYIADNGAKVFSISSAHVEDGKSLISANLALCMAEDPGRRVLLLDCDLRRPAVHRQFGVALAPGLVNHLLEEALPPHCYVRRIGNLFVMTAGEIADNPIALFSLSRTQELLDYARKEFDTVIVDSPPLLPISDARVISKLSDGTLMVIRRGKTPYSAIEKALLAIDQRRFVGTVLNEVPASRYNSYYSYSYSAYYNSEHTQEGIIELKSGSYDWTDVTRTKRR